MSNVRFSILILSFSVIALSCTHDDANYKRIVNKTWIQDSSHSLLTAYSFEFEDYVGKTFGEFLTDYPDSVHLRHYMEDPAWTLRGWIFRYGADEFQVKVFFNYDSYSELITRDSIPTTEWDINDHLNQKIHRFEVRDLKNSNTIVPHKYDKLNREISD